MGPSTLKPFVIHQSARRQELIRLRCFRHLSVVQSDAVKARHRQDQIVRRAAGAKLTGSV